MKKKAILWFVLLCCTISPLVAQKAKFYDDFEGHRGYAEARYETKVANADPSKYGDPGGWYYDYEPWLQKINPDRRITKLSKEDSFLIWSALNEYEILTDEIYQVAIIRSDDSLALFTVAIKNNGESFQWHGGWVYEK